ncbi:MAG: OmpA family protein [Vicinamibacterales bacterium]
MKKTHVLSVLIMLLALSLAACGGKKPPVPNAPAPAPSAFPGAVTPSTTPARPPDPPPIPPDTSVRATPLLPWEDKPLEEINGPNSPLKPALFLYDSDELDETARKVLTADAEVLKSYKTWVVTVEGHSDERGTAEYNLALGDRRAMAARNFLVSLGVGADRLRTVSYGKEFPFDPAHNESAWSQNRRAHLMLTSK